MCWHYRNEAEKQCEDERTPRQRDVSNSASIKVLVSAAQEKRHLPQFALPDHISDNKVSPDMRSSPCPVHGNDSSEKVCPPNSWNFHLSASDGRSHHLLHNGNRSPGADLPQKNSVHVPDMDCKGRFDLILTDGQKSLGKWIDNPEANAVWKSFESVLETLSRTKESIGRATRLAIDCARYGIAGEVSLFCINYASLLII